VNQFDKQIDNRSDGECSGTVHFDIDLYPARTPDKDINVLNACKYTTEIAKVIMDNL